MAPCQHHQDIDARLRAKDRRITVLEQEVGHMKEEISKIDQLRASIDSLKTWMLTTMGGAAVLLWLADHWDLVTKIAQGSGS